MEINKELITRFLNNQCSADEAEYIAAQVKLNPYLLDELLPEEEWDRSIDPLILEEDRKQEMLGQIRQQLSDNKFKRNYNWWLGIAASVLILLIPGIIMNRPVATAPQKGDVVYNLVKINYGKTDLPIEIEDGSFILLKAGSEIRYPEHFTGKDRSFYLKGEARFKVAKDRKRPFNVHAEGTITTAIGTDFTVLALTSDPRTRIILHEGRVVVKLEHPQRFAHFKNVYLNAGEEVSLDRVSYLALRRRSKVNQLMQMAQRRTEGSTEISLTEITFKNQSLKNIYQSLDKEFSVSIRYKEKEIADRYFTGSFKRDSLTLGKILQETALLNQLRIEKRDGIYYLSLKRTNINNKIN